MKNTDTYKLLLLLRAESFKCRITKTFDYSYSENWNILTVNVYDAQSKMDKLFEIVRKTGCSFNITMSRYSKNSEIFFSIRKSLRFADIVADEHPSTVEGVTELNTVISQEDYSKFITGYETP